MLQFLNPFRWIYLITTPCSVNILFSCSSHATSKSTLTPIKLVKSLPWLDNPPRFELCIILGWSLDSNRRHRGCQSLNRSERPKAGNHYPAKHEFHSLMAGLIYYKISLEWKYRVFRLKNVRKKWQLHLNHAYLAISWKRQSAFGIW